MLYHLKHLIHLSFYVKNLPSKLRVYDELCEKIQEQFKQANIEVSVYNEPENFGHKNLRYEG